MKIIAPELNLENFWNRLRVATTPVLILDYDGTLAPFQIDPASALPYPKVPPMLETLMEQKRTRVIIVSGRPADQVRVLLGLQKPLEIWGCHGAERLDGRGDYHAVELAVDTARALDNASEKMEKSNFGGRLEIKPFSLAAHWRGMDGNQIESARTEARRILQEFSGAIGIVATRF